ncbi:hypothetical protein L1887_42408 [Cichorium endivia]|nr:hypothetical protein L1887_42408 [Cichorium endivia]
MLTSSFHVVELGLGHLPFTEKQVTTPTGSVYTGVDFCKRLCGVSVIRSGERLGDNGQQSLIIVQLIYEKLPQDISERHVLLLDPILGTGNSAVEAIKLLIKKGVPEGNIIFLNLISVSPCLFVCFYFLFLCWHWQAPQGVHVVCKKFPRIKIVTSEIEIKSFVWFQGWVSLETDILVQMNHHESSHSLKLSSFTFAVRPSFLHLLCLMKFIPKIDLQITYAQPSFFLVFICGFKSSMRNFFQYITGSPLSSPVSHLPSPKNP